MQQYLISRPEGIAMLVALAVGILLWRFGSAFEQRMVDSFTLRRPANWYTYLLVSLFGGLAPAAASFLLGKPQPIIHDEFNHLLVADTLGAGKLSYPSHPLWTFFESMHLCQTPAVFSRFPPGQGLALAIGNVLGGDPIVGVWLIAAGMTFSLFWAIRAFVPNAIALITTIIVFSHVMILSYWAQGYMGGGLAVIGGAIVVGSWRRLSEHSSFSLGLLLTLGLGILAFSRPFEGVLLFVPISAQLLYWLFKKARPNLGAAAKGFACGAVVIIASLACYNLGTTGKVTTHPYTLYSTRYESTPTFVWQEKKPPIKFRHPEMAAAEVFFSQSYDMHRKSIRDFLTANKGKLNFAIRFFLSPVALIGLLFAIPSFRRPSHLLLLTMLALGALGMAGLFFFFTHYVAPFVVVLAVLVATGYWRLSKVRFRGRPIGAIIVSVLIIVPLVAVVLECRERLNSSLPTPFLVQKSKLEDELSAGGSSRHLVFVRYGEEHSFHFEWVYNKADLKNAPVIWAHDMGDSMNRELIDFEKDRKVWLFRVESDFSRTDFQPYSP